MLVRRRKQFWRRYEPGRFSPSTADDRAQSGTTSSLSRSSSPWPRRHTEARRLPPSQDAWRGGLGLGMLATTVALSLPSRYHRAFACCIRDRPRNRIGRVELELSPTELRLRNRSERSWTKHRLPDEREVDLGRPLAKQVERLAAPARTANAVTDCQAEPRCGAVRDGHERGRGDGNRLALACVLASAFGESPPPFLSR